jgi:hypothetical protein
MPAMGILSTQLVGPCLLMIVYVRSLKFGKKGWAKSEWQIEIYGSH